MMLSNAAENSPRSRGEKMLWLSLTSSIKNQK
jgi:hypothetical protein